MFEPVYLKSLSVSCDAYVSLCLVVFVSTPPLLLKAVQTYCRAGADDILSLSSTSGSSTSGFFYCGVLSSRHVSKPFGSQENPVPNTFR